MVHPVPVPIEDKEDIISINREIINNHNLILFIRGKAISGVSDIIGINQFPKPPIIVGITIKKIMMKACLVTIVL